MCELGHHNCAHCGDEFKCGQHNHECPVFNGYEDYCYRCEEADDYYEQESKRGARRKWEREEWASQFQWD